MEFTMNDIVSRLQAGIKHPPWVSPELLQSALDRILELEAIAVPVIAVRKCIKTNAQYGEQLKT
jgi:hypothetical protein